MNVIGNKIKHLREEAKMTLKQLSDNTGVGQSTISDIETGKAKNPKMTTLKKIADYFNVSVDELMKSESVTKEKLNKYESVIKEESETYECTNSILNGNDTSLTGIINRTTDVKEIMELILSQPVLTLNGKILDAESKIALENAIKMALAYAEQKQKEDDPKNK